METNKKNILLVDNNDFVRLMFSNVFWVHGLNDECSFITARDFDEAKKIICEDETTPDIIFTELIIPTTKNGEKETTPESGLSFISEIKNNPKTAKARIVVFSNWDEPEYQEKAQKAGADMYIKKDNSLPTDLIQIVHSFEIQ